jgi:hypothetical protein
MSAVRASSQSVRDPSLEAAKERSHRGERVARARAKLNLTRPAGGTSGR